MSISDLEQHYGKPYNRAYFEIKEVGVSPTFTTYVTV